MDFLDPKKTRAHHIKLYIGYGLMAILLAFGAYLLLATAQGNWIDSKGNVYQNGIVFVASDPGQAEVRIKNTQTNKEQKTVTAERLVLPAGQYSFEFLKQGYRPWQHTADVRGASIERLVYPLLFPENLVTSTIASYRLAPRMTSTSPNRQILIVQPNSKEATIEVYDTNSPESSEKAPEILELPNSLLTLGNNALQIVEWSANNRQVLVKNQLGKRSEFIVLDIQDISRSFNVNQRFDVRPVEVSLFDQRASSFYMRLPDDSLVRANTQPRNLEIVADEVLAFKSYGNEQVLYAAATNRSSTDKVSVFVHRGDQSYKIRELPVAKKYLLDIARYENHWNVVMGSSNDDHVYMYQDPVETLTSGDANRVMIVRSMRINQPQHVSFSENAQFIAAQSAGNFVVYDNFQSRQFVYKIDSPFDDNKFATWMDGYRLTNISGGTVVVFDFDGTNYQTLSPALPGSRVLFNGNYQQMFTLGTNADKKAPFALTQTKLRVE